MLVFAGDHGAPGWRVGLSAGSDLADGREFLAGGAAINVFAAPERLGCRWSMPAWRTISASNAPG
jgi:hypothetical protein